MIGYRQVSEAEFKTKAIGNQPYIRTMEYGHSVINIMRDGNIVGKIVEIREHARGMYKLGYSPKPKIRKEYYLRSGHE